MSTVVVTLVNIFQAEITIELCSKGHAVRSAVQFYSRKYAQISQ